MRLSLNAFLLAICFTASLQAQNVAEYAFNQGIKGIYFDSVELIRIVPKDDGMKVFLQLHRTGTVQKKNGSLLSGGKDKIQLAALGVVTFSKDLKVLSEEVTYLKPKDATSKQFNLLEGTARIVVDDKIIGTQDDCVDGQSGFYEKYPELRKKETEAATAMPSLVYKNTISYSMMGGKPKTFDSNVYTPKGTSEDVDKGFFQQMMASESQYDRKSSEVDMESYRGSDKKNFWLRMSDPVCDPRTGIVHAHHGHMITGEYSNRGNLYEQETVTFDKDGKELKRTEIKFDKPHELGLREVFTTELGAEEMQSVDGIAHAYTQLYGIGYKKMNPTPDPLAGKLMHWDANGELKQNVDFKLPAEGTKFHRGFMNGNQVTVLASSYKPVSLYTIHFANGKMTDTKAYDANSDFVKRLGFKPTEINGDNYQYHYSYTQPDGSKLMVYEIIKPMMQGQNKINASQGFVFFKVEKDGTVAQVQNLKRSAKADPGYKVRLSTYPTEDGNYTFVLKDPLLGNKDAVKAIYLNGSSLEAKELFNFEDAANLSSSHFPGSNNVVFMYYDTKDKKHKLKQVAL